jgi:predicted transcriptional regulator
MKDKQHQSPQFSDNEGNQFQRQIQRVYNLLKTTSATRKEISVLLDIDRANICWHVDNLKDNFRLWIVRKRKCSITGYTAEELTCNPELKPEDHQLKMLL